MLLVDIVLGLNISHMLESGITDQQAGSHKLGGHYGWQTLCSVNVCFCIRVN